MARSDKLQALSLMEAYRQDSDKVRQINLIPAVSLGQSSDCCMTPSLLNNKQFENIMTRLEGMSVQGKTMKCSMKTWHASLHLHWSSHPALFCTSDKIQIKDGGTIISGSCSGYCNLTGKFCTFNKNLKNIDSINFHMHIWNLDFLPHVQSRCP